MRKPKRSYNLILMRFVHAHGWIEVDAEIKTDYWYFRKKNWLATIHWRTKTITFTRISKEEARKI
jgi:hypothetical protein